jgi:hypothetical protein
LFISGALPHIKYFFALLGKIAAKKKTGMNTARTKCQIKFFIFLTPYFIVNNNYFLSIA